MPDTIATILLTDIPCGDLGSCEAGTGSAESGYLSGDSDFMDIGTGRLNTHHTVTRTFR